MDVVYISLNVCELKRRVICLFGGFEAERIATIYRSLEANIEAYSSASNAISMSEFFAWHFRSVESRSI
jgi:hypothetical protein